MLITSDDEIRLGNIGHFYYQFIHKIAIIFTDFALFSGLNHFFAILNHVMKMGSQSDARYLPQDTLANFAVEIGIGIRTVRTAFIKLMDSIESKAPPLVDEYRISFGALAILEDITNVIRYRIAKGRALVL